MVPISSVDGQVYTWGRGFKGFEDAQVPHCLSSSLKFIKVALGWNHALLMSGIDTTYPTNFMISTFLSITYLISAFCCQFLLHR